MSKIYNWDELRQEYILGDYSSLNDFLEKKGIPRSPSARVKIENWDELKSYYNTIKVNNTINYVANEEAKKNAKELITVNEVSRIGLKKAKELSNNISNMGELKSLTSALKDLKEIIIDENDGVDKPSIFIPAKDIGKAFVDLNRWIDDRKYRDIWLEGGRGSIKSSYWSEKAVEILENNPNMCAICIRMVGNTLKDSVYSQFEWGIDQMNEAYPGLKKRWHGTKSPLEYKNLDTGQIVYFRGADDPGKIKSIKPPKDKYIGLIIYEEFDQMKGMAEVRKIDQSLKRGGNDIVTFRVYNTPRSTQHFVNKEKILEKQDRIIHTSTYLDVPEEFLGQPFIDDANYLKEVNYQAWENEYLGKMTGTGGNVFENVELRDITDEEINSFDYIYQGLDFGWFPDPLAWTKCCYNPAQQTLYIFDEFVVNKMSNADVWEYLKENKGVTNEDMIIADSAENKSIGDFRSYGSCMRGAEKGPGSVDYSMKWLSSLAKIVIDAKRCPVSAEEFTTYEYLKDKDGNYISGYIDADNHCIDSIRYALNNIWKKRGN